MSFQPFNSFFTLSSTPRSLAQHLLADEQSLLAICLTLHSIGISCFLKGEFLNILTFTDAPLSFTLHITVGSSASNVRVIKDRENASRECTIEDEADLQTLCSSVLQFQKKKIQEEERGMLRPVPKSDATLLSCLIPSLTGQLEGSTAHVERFAEA